MATTALRLRRAAIGGGSVSLAYLSSGADVFVVPQEAVDMAESRFNKGWHRAVNAATFGYSLRPNQHEHFRAAQDGQSFFILLTKFVLTKFVKPCHETKGEGCWLRGVPGRFLYRAEHVLCLPRGMGDRFTIHTLCFPGYRSSVLDIS